MTQENKGLLGTEIETIKTKKDVDISKENESSSHPWWKTFFGFNTSLLYCLSACSIIYGLADIITPILAKKGDVLFEKLACLGVLSIYELALFGIILLLVLKRKVFDDAICLMILIALFIVGSALTANSLAIDYPQLSLIIGVILSIITMWKLYVLKTKLKVNINSHLSIAISLMVIWNFLISPILALAITNVDEGSNLIRIIWKLNWVIIITSCVFFLKYLQSLKIGQLHKESIKKVFFKTSGMGWIFSLILFIACIAHQYILTYAFVIDYSLGDFLLIAICSTFLLLELLRVYAVMNKVFIKILAYLPLVLCLGIIILQKYTIVALYSLLYPPTLIAISGLFLLYLSTKNGGWYRLKYQGIIYFFGFLLTVGVSPETISLNSV